MPLSNDHFSSFPQSPAGDRVALTVDLLRVLTTVRRGGELEIPRMIPRSGHDAGVLLARRALEEWLGENSSHGTEKAIDYAQGVLTDRLMVWGAADQAAAVTIPNDRPLQSLRECPRTGSNSPLEPAPRSFEPAATAGWGSAI